MKKIHQQDHKDPVSVVVPPNGFGNLGKALEEMQNPEAGVKEEHDGDYSQLDDVSEQPGKPG